MTLTLRQFESPKIRKHCTQSCAGHFRKRSEASREKTRQSMKGRPSPKKGTRFHRESTPEEKRARERTCDFCKCSFYAHDRKFCSQKCWQDSVASHRTEREIYKHACQFKFNVYDYPETFDLSMLTEHGWYRAANRGNNLDGVSRDHMISITEGFKRKIDPKIISHPANCMLVLHRFNQRKNTKSSITIEELQERITQFTSRYPSSLRDPFATRAFVGANPTRDSLPVTT